VTYGSYGGKPAVMVLLPRLAKKDAEVERLQNKRKNLVEEKNDLMANDFFPFLCGAGIIDLLVMRDDARDLRTVTLHNRLPSGFPFLFQFCCLRQIQAREQDCTGFTG
jgi:hypothetical protein